MKYFEIYWSDLTAERQEELRKDGVYHENIILTPLAIIEIEDDDIQHPDDLSDNDDPRDHPITGDDTWFTDPSEEVAEIPKNTPAIMTFAEVCKKGGRIDMVCTDNPGKYMWEEYKPHHYQAITHPQNTHTSLLHIYWDEIAPYDYRPKTYPEMHIEAIDYLEGAWTTDKEDDIPYDHDRDEFFE